MPNPWFDLIAGLPDFCFPVFIRNDVDPPRTVTRRDPRGEAWRYTSEGARREVQHFNAANRAPIAIKPMCIVRVYLKPPAVLDSLTKVAEFRNQSLTGTETGRFTRKDRGHITEK